MNFLEKELEQIIWESDNEKLWDKGFPIYGKKFRQLRIGNYGVLDLLTVSRNQYIEHHTRYITFLDITVYELKKEKVGISAFLQAIKYCKGIKTYLETRKPNLEFKLHIVLCGKSVDLNSDFIYLPELLSHDIDIPNGNINSVEVYSFGFNIDGIIFKPHSGYSLTNSGF